MSKLNRWLRAKQKIFLVVVCCVCMVTFVVGPGALRLLDPDLTPEGTIFGETVSGKRAYNLARNLIPFFGENRPSDPEMFAHAWQLLIMDREADRCGIAVSDSEMTEFLTSRFAGPDGSFEAARYAEFLQRSGVNRAEYEETLRLLLRDFKVRSAVHQSIALPEEEAWMWYTQDRQRVKARYVMLDAHTLSKLTSPSEEEVHAFYEKYKDIPKLTGPYDAGYQRPEHVKIEYVLASREKFEESATVSEDDILDYYEEHKADYAVPENEDAEISGDSAAAEETDEAADEDAPAYKPLAEVRPQIVEKLRREAADTAMEETMKQVNKAIWEALEVPFGSQQAGVADLKEIAAQFGLTYVETDFFAAADCAKILPGAPELRRKAFNQGMGGLGVVSPRLKAREGEFVFRVLESQPPEPRPFEEVQDDVTKHCRLKTAADLAQTIASRAGEAPDFDTAAETIRSAVADLLADLETPDDGKGPEAYFTVAETDFFGRVQVSRFGGREHRYHLGAGLPGNATSTNFADAAFNLNDGETALVVDSEQTPKYFFVLERTGVEFPSREDFEQEKDRVMPRLLSDKRTDVVETWQADLRARANPSPEVMKFLQLLPEWAG